VRFFGYVDDPTAGPLGPGDKCVAVVTSEESAEAVARLLGAKVEWWKQAKPEAHAFHWQRGKRHGE
jgi:hypothetical protein